MVSAWGRVAESPSTINVKNIANGDHLGGVLEGLVHAATGAPVARRKAVHHGCPIRRGEHAHRDAVAREHHRKHGIGEVDRQNHQQTEAERGADHASAREPARSKAV